MQTDRPDDAVVLLRVVVAVALLAVGVVLVAWPLVDATPTSGLWLQVLVGGALGVVGGRDLTQQLQR